MSRLQAMSAKQPLKLSMENFCPVLNNSWGVNMWYSEAQSKTKLHKKLRCKNKTFFFSITKEKTT
jgi:hypothetical protein